MTSQRWDVYVIFFLGACVLMILSLTSNDPCPSSLDEIAKQTHDSSVGLDETCDHHPTHRHVRCDHFLPSGTRIKFQRVQEVTDNWIRGLSKERQQQRPIPLPEFEWWESVDPSSEEREALKIAYARPDPSYFHPILPLEHFQGKSELPVIETFLFLLRQDRYNPNDTNVFVVDVGANSGFFTSLAALRGYTALAFEPQPDCIPWIALHAFRNGVAARVCITNAGVSLTEGEISVTTRGCDPLYMTAQPMAQPTTDGDVDGIDLTVPAVSLHRLFADEDTVSSKTRKECPVIKIDTEGAEIGVLESLEVALKTHQVRNLLVELAPHVWVARDPEHGLARGYGVLSRLISDYGYRFKALDDGEPHDTKRRGDAPFTELAHLSWYDVPDLRVYLQELARVNQGDNVLFTLDA